MRKVKNENVATFLDVYDVFGSKLCHFSILTRKMKVIQLFKAKMEAFRDEKSKKVKNDQNFLHLTFVLSVEMKTVFSVREPETLRKPMLLEAFC